MALNHSKQTIIPLLIFGFFSLFAGLGIAFLKLSFNLLTIGLTLAGIISFILVAFELNRKSILVSRNFNLQRRILISVVIIVFFFLYLGVNYLGKVYNKRIDLTKYKQHTLSKETVERLKKLKQDIKMTAFIVGLPPKYVEDLLKEYEHYSNGRVTTEIIDPLVQISYAAQFGNIINAQEQKVIVQSGKEQNVINFTDLTLEEQHLNQAVVGVTRKARTICFLTGHGEYRLYDEKETGLSKFSAHMLANNMIGQSVNIEVDQGIADSCEVLVIAGAKDQLSAKEENAIRDYLKKGGDVLFLIENTLVTTPDKPLTEEELEKNPSLNNLLKDFGLEVQKDVVVDLESHASGDVGSPATRNYLPHEAIVKGLDYTIFIRPRSIRMIKDRPKEVKVVPLILTASAEKSWGETNRMLEIKYDPEVDRGGPVPIGFVAMEPKNNQKKSNTRMVVITDADFITNAYISFYSNAQLGLNALAWLSDMEYDVLLDKKEIKVEQLNLTSGQKRQVVLILILIPLLVILTGTIVWVMRHKK